MKRTKSTNNVAAAIRKAGKAASQATTVKAEDLKKVEAKTEEAVKAVEAKATTLAKETVAKVAAKKPVVKKEKMKIFLQFGDREYTAADVEKKVKEVWTKEMKQKVSDMKTAEVYLKPEEFAAYYVINGDVTGKIDL